MNSLVFMGIPLMEVSTQISFSWLLNKNRPHPEYCLFPNLIKTARAPAISSFWTQVDCERIMSREESPDVTRYTVCSFSCVWVNTGINRSKLPSPAEKLISLSKSASRFQLTGVFPDAEKSIPAFHFRNNESGSFVFRCSEIICSVF